MRNGLFVFALLILSALGCAPTEAAATEESPDIDEPPTSIPAPEELTSAQRAVLRALSGSLGIAEELITLVSTEAVDWPDGCLGIQEEGLMCTQVITPGFRVIAEANGREVEYHTNEDGTQVRPATVLMRWKREGGIAGFCDLLTVYLSGEVHRSSCKSGEYVEERVSNILSEAEIAKLEEWVQEYGTVNIDASDPKGVSDRMVVTLEFFGLGDQETISSANETELLEFARLLSQSSPLK